MYTHTSFLTFIPFNILGNIVPRTSKASTSVDMYMYSIMYIHNYIYTYKSTCRYVYVCAVYTCTYYTYTYIKVLVYTCRYVYVCAVYTCT